VHSTENRFVSWIAMLVRCLSDTVGNAVFVTYQSAIIRMSDCTEICWINNYLCRGGYLEGGVL